MKDCSFLVLISVYTVSTEFVSEQEEQVDDNGRSKNNENMKHNKNNEIQEDGNEDYNMESENEGNYIEAVQCSSDKSRLRVARCAEFELQFRQEVNYHLLQEVERLTVPAVHSKLQKSVHS